MLHVLSARVTQHRPSSPIAGLTRPSICLAHHMFAHRKQTTTNTGIVFFEDLLADDGAKAKQLLAKVEEVWSTRPQTLIHGDFNSGNVWKSRADGPSLLRAKGASLCTEERTKGYHLGPPRVKEQGPRLVSRCQSAVSLPPDARSRSIEVTIARAVRMALSLPREGNCRRFSPTKRSKACRFRPRVWSCDALAALWPGSFCIADWQLTRMGPVCFDFLTLFVTAVPSSTGDGKDKEIVKA